MIDAAEALAAFAAFYRRPDVSGSEQRPSVAVAVVRAIEILGEAASRLSPEAQAQIAEVPWASVVGMRNRLVHGYFDVDTEIVWTTATIEVPALLEVLNRAMSDPEAEGQRDR